MRQSSQDSLATPQMPQPDNIDKSPNSWLRGALLALLTVAAVSCVFLVSAQIIGLDENGILNRTFRGFVDSPWALPVVITAFSAASFIGAPQFLLIAVTVAVFGPVKGFLFSVAATIVSASLNFLIARSFGAEWLRKRNWNDVDRVMDMVGRNGFVAALLVRVIPSAPFIVVNMGLGLTKTSYIAFITGTAIGILPKTALIALLGKVVERAQSGDAQAILYLIAAAVTWLALAFAGRWALQRRNGSKPGA